MLVNIADRVSCVTNALRRASISPEATRLARNELRSRLARPGATALVGSTRVLGFDADVQESLLASVGIANRGPFLLITQTLVIAAALLVIYAGWMQLRTRSRVDRVKTLYERFCRRAAHLGVRRSPWEGPSDFSRRAAQLLPNEAERIRQISNTYITLRYSAESAAVVLNRFAKEVKQFGEHSH